MADDDPVTAKQRKRMLRRRDAAARQQALAVRAAMDRAAAHGESHLRTYWDLALATERVLVGLGRDRELPPEADALRRRCVSVVPRWYAAAEAAARAGVAPPAPPAEGQPAWLREAAPRVSLHAVERFAERCEPAMRHEEAWERLRALGPELEPAGRAPGNRSLWRHAAYPDARFLVVPSRHDGAPIVVTVLRADERFVETAAALADEEEPPPCR